MSNRADRTPTPEHPILAPVPVLGRPHVPGVVWFGPWGAAVPSLVGGVAGTCRWPVGGRWEDTGRAPGGQKRCNSAENLVEWGVQQDS